MKGKKLEKEIKEYLKKNKVLYHKFNDSFASRGYTIPVPSDFIVFPLKGKAVLLECKETQKTKLPLTAFRPVQFEYMKKTANLGSCTYYAIIKSKNKYYLFHSSTILDELNKGAKSIDVEDGFLYMNTLKDTITFLFDENEEYKDL